MKDDADSTEPSINYSIPSFGSDPWGSSPEINQEREYNTNERQRYWIASRKDTPYYTSNDENSSNDDPNNNPVFDWSDVAIDYYSVAWNVSLLMQLRMRMQEQFQSKIQKNDEEIIKNEIIESLSLT